MAAAAPPVAAARSRAASGAGCSTRRMVAPAPRDAAARRAGPATAGRKGRKERERKTKRWRSEAAQERGAEEGEGGALSAVGRDERREEGHERRDADDPGPQDVPGAPFGDEDEVEVVEERRQEAREGEKTQGRGGRLVRRTEEEAEQRGGSEEADGEDGPDEGEGEAAGRDVERGDAVALAPREGGGRRREIAVGGGLPDEVEDARQAPRDSVEPDDGGRSEGAEDDDVEPERRLGQDLRRRVRAQDRQERFGGRAGRGREPPFAAT